MIRVVSSIVWVEEKELVKWDGLHSSDPKTINYNPNERMPACSNISRTREKRFLKQIYQYIVFMVVWKRGVRKFTGPGYLNRAIPLISLAKSQMFSPSCCSHSNSMLPATTYTNQTSNISYKMRKWEDDPCYLAGMPDHPEFPVCKVQMNFSPSKSKLSVGQVMGLTRLPILGGFRLAMILIWESGCFAKSDFRIRSVRLVQCWFRFEN